MVFVSLICMQRLRGKSKRGFPHKATSSQPANPILLAQSLFVQCFISFAGEARSIHNQQMPRNSRRKYNERVSHSTACCSPKASLFQLNAEEKRTHFHSIFLVSCIVLQQQRLSNGFRIMFLQRRDSEQIEKASNDRRSKRSRE